MKKRIIVLRQKLAIQLQKRIQVQVSPNNMLFGSQGGGRSAKLWSKDMGDCSLPSKRVGLWPHTSLLDDYDKFGGKIFLEEYFRETEYYQNAVSCIREYSRFTWCKNEDEIVLAAKYFVEKIHSKAVGQRKTQGGKHNLPVIVRKIKGSSMYQVCDGHHRVSRAHFQKEASIGCFINPWPKVYTPAQEKIISLYGRMEVLQELTEVPETTSWPIAYSVKMIMPVIEQFISQIGRDEISILDLACSYGTIAKSLNQFNNINILGVEHRRIAFEIALNCNKVQDNNILHDSYSTFLENTEKKFDLVVVNIDRVVETMGEINTLFCESLVKVVSRCLIVYSKSEQSLVSFKNIVDAISNDIKLKCISLK